MSEELVIPIVAILMPVFLVPTIIAMKHRQKKREWEHLERMKLAEMGGSPVSVPDSAVAKSILMIGGGVPMASVFAAYLTSSSVPFPAPHSLEIAAVSWGCAFLISMAALVTSLVLGVVHSRSLKNASSHDLREASKPVYEPDLFDVVGRRG